MTDDDAASGTSAHGVARAIDELAGGRLAALPVTGLDARGVRALLHAAAEGTVPVVLIANVQTGAFWGSHATAAQLAAYLERGDRAAGPGPIGRSGTSSASPGLSEGRAGALVTVADTYPVLGLAGVHLQPVERVAAALAGRGVLVVAEPDVARRVADAAGGAGELWDNGSPLPAAAEPPFSVPQPEVVRHELVGPGGLAPLAARRELAHAGLDVEHRRAVDRIESAYAGVVPSLAEQLADRYAEAVRPRLGALREDAHLGPIGLPRGRRASLVSESGSTRWKW